MKNIGIIGGGAAGLFCAAMIINNFQGDLSITILEKQARVGKKILVSGNGKCNLSNLHITKDNYNTPLIDDLLKKFNGLEVEKVFRSLGLMVKSDNEGRIYPYSERANTVLDILLKAINKKNVNVITNINIKKIEKCDQIFNVYTIDNKFTFDYLVFSTGSKASVNYNVDGYDLLKSMRHHITKLTPSLVALKVKENVKSLSGLRVKANVKLYNDNVMVDEAFGEVLFKDDGLSGIAIMSLSRKLENNSIISLDLAFDKTKNELDEFIKEKNNIFGILPKMICEDILKRTNNKDKVINTIKDYRFSVLDTYSFDMAQTTRGGVYLNEVDMNNFRSKIVDNLYIIGEVLDVDGTCGGYNLHFAWTSAYFSAMDIIRRLS